MSVLNNSKFGISLKKNPKPKKKRNHLDFNYPEGKGRNSPGEQLWAVRRGWGKALLCTVPGNIKKPGQIGYSSTSYFYMWCDTWMRLGKASRRTNACGFSQALQDLPGKSVQLLAALLIWWTLCLWDYCGKKRIRAGHHPNVILTQYTSVQAWELFLS